MSSRDPLGRLAATCICLLLGVLSAAASSSAVGRVDVEAGRQGLGSGSTSWLGPDGQPLPFAGEDEILDFLRSASIVERKEIEKGINKAVRLTLEQDGVRARAIFRTVQQERRPPGSPPWEAVQDSYAFEVAAYELARLLDLDRIPPATFRTVDGRRGSIQLWVEEAKTEADRITSGQPHRDRERFLRQKQVMDVFDNLIYNFDRHANNMLLDAHGKLWLVDHTRSFPSVPRLADPDTIVGCERHLYERLLELDPIGVRERLEPVLHKPQIGALLRRHRQIVKRIAGLIERQGEEQVLF